MKLVDTGDPSPKFQAQLIHVGLFGVVKFTHNGAQPVNGVPVNVGTGGALTVIVTTAESFGVVQPSDKITV